MTAIELIENNHKIELICMHVTQSFPQEHSKLDVQNQMKAKGLTSLQVKGLATMDTTVK